MSEQKTKKRFQPTATCPTCGSVREVRPLGDGFVMVKHGRGRYFKCPGSSTPVEDVREVISWARGKRCDAQRVIDNAPSERDVVRLELAKKIDAITERAEAATLEIGEIDRFIERAMKKVKTS